MGARLGWPTQSTAGTNGRPRLETRKERRRGDDHAVQHEGLAPALVPCCNRGAPLEGQARAKRIWHAERRGTLGGAQRACVLGSRLYCLREERRC
jgi:hypothetical protein